MLTIPDGSVILNLAIARQSRPTNCVTTDFREEAKDIRAVQIGFDYLDVGQGVALEVYHTASDPASIWVTGTVMGIPKGATTVSAGSQMRLPVGLGVSAVVTIPTSQIPRHLRNPKEEPNLTFSATLQEIILKPFLRSMRRWR
ncbi:hypothetical protein GCM10010178_18340 [Lentzea flava]|uniref:Uncharacterized protein n=2 Tax=Lentzea flava TaxID=103732 RepID=A0ABQ2UEC8_9PSEU|nr:hypothetical protein GCM10010178_18340 [Lentzea flava]